MFNLNLQGYKTMINKITSGIALCALAFAPQAFAYKYFEEPTIGVEAIQDFQKYKANFGDVVFKKNPQEYGIFGGFKFSKHFGIELGYDAQPSKGQNINIVPGESLPGGAIVSAGNSLSVESWVRANHGYLGLFAEKKCHFSGFGKMKFQALIAASVTGIKARHATLATGVGVNSQAQYQASVRHYRKTRVVPMVKLSATYMVTDAVGVRLSGNYRNMSAFKVNAKENFANQLKFKDSFGVGLGLSYTFN
jgi:hypothetical protein